VSSADGKGTEPAVFWGGPRFVPREARGARKTKTLTRTKERRGVKVSSNSLVVRSTNQKGEEGTEGVSPCSPQREDKKKGLKGKLSKMTYPSPRMGKRGR